MEGLISKAKWLLGIAMAVATAYSFIVPGAGRFSEPELARIFFFHFPNPILATFCQIAAAVFSWRYLKDGNLKHDANALALSELGAIFSVNTMLTGVIFSRVQWGAWWQSDPRQTSYLFVTLIFLAYLVLRSTISDLTSRARKASVYAISAILPELFLTFVFPRLPQIEAASFHPTPTISQGQLDRAYGTSITAILILVTIFAWWLYRLRAKSLELEYELENGQLEIHLNGTAPTGVVRPVSVPDEG